jgi:predicted ATPase
MHLLERKEQLEALNWCFQEARTASGKLVLLAGEAGLGKSSLVEQFVSEHRRAARRFGLRATGSPRRGH